MPWMAAAGQIGFNALTSFIGGRSAYKNQQAQVAIQRAQAYQSQAREYAQLTESIKAVGRQNEALVRAEAYTFSNLLSNKGAMELRDSQLKRVMARNKLMLRREGTGAVGSIVAEQGALGAVGASAQAMQNDVRKKVDEAMNELSEQRTNQVYDLHRQNEVMFTQFYQNQQMVDDSTINEAFLPQDPIMLGAGSGGMGKFLPHLIASGIGFGANHYAQQWMLDLNNSNSRSVGNPQFAPKTNVSTPYAYR